VKRGTNAAAPLIDDVGLLEDLRGDAVLELHEAEPFALLAITNHFRIRHSTEGGEVLTQGLTSGRRVEPADKDLALRARRVRDRGLGRLVLLLRAGGLRNLHQLEARRNRH